MGALRILASAEADPLQLRSVAARLLAGVLAVLAGLALVFWLAGREQRAIGSLPGAERARLYQSVRTEFDVQCADGAPDALKDNCRVLAQRLRLFPECDAACLDRTAPFVRSRAR